MQTYSAGIASIEMSVIDDSIFDLVENDNQIIAIENVSRARQCLIPDRVNTLYRQ